VGGRGRCPDSLLTHFTRRSADLNSHDAVGARDPAPATVAGASVEPETAAAKAVDSAMEAVAAVETPATMEAVPAAMAAAAMKGMTTAGATAMTAGPTSAAAGRCIGRRKSYRCADRGGNSTRDDTLTQHIRRLLLRHVAPEDESFGQAC
jgi:hypothetical protein